MGTPARGFGVNHGPGNPDHGGLHARRNNSSSPVTSRIGDDPTDGTAEAGGSRPNSPRV
jgi:hypothetical protein